MDEEQIVDLLFQANLQRSIKYFGIEGTEEKIKDCYSEMSYVRDKYLQKYKEYLKK